METGTKHPRTTKFLDLAAKAGWNQAEVARALKRSRGQISKIFNEKTVPPASLVDLLEYKVNAVAALHEHADRMGQQAVEFLSMPVHEQLSYLRKHDPAGYRVATETIETLHRRAVDAETEVILHEKKPKPPPPNSAEVSQAAVEASGAAEKIERGAPAGTEQYGAVASPPARKVAPAPASSRPAKARRTAHGGKVQK